jgi:hypothetical protein
MPSIFGINALILEPDDLDIGAVTSNGRLTDMESAKQEEVRVLLSKFKSALTAYEAAALAVFRHVERGIAPPANEILEEASAKSRLSDARRNLWRAWTRRPLTTSPAAQPGDDVRARPIESRDGSSDAAELE